MRPPDCQIGKDEAMALLKRGFGRELHRIAASYTSPIFWGQPSSSDTPEIASSGSMFFLQCGERPFAVTANHVYQGYWLRKEREPDLICQVGNISFVPEERLIDRDATLDIATFRLEEREVQIDSKQIHKPRASEWPPRPPQKGRGVFFAGFPGVCRQRIGGNRVRFGCYAALLTATTVDDEKIVCHLEREGMADDFGTGLPPQQQWLGGLSGAPLWTLVQGDIVYWRLGGIIVEYNREFELICARRFDRITPDGTLVR